MQDNIDTLIRERQLANHFDSSNWQIQKSDISGHGVFATRNLEPGDVIFQEIPLVTGPRAVALPAACVTCFKANAPLEACENGCRLPLCSRDCGKADSHQEECRLLKGLSPKSEAHWSPYLYRALTPLRCLLLSDVEKRIVSCLCPNKNDKHLEAMLLSNEIEKGLTPEDESFFRHSCSVLNGTAFEVNLDDGSYSLTLRGLFPLAGMMNHCCSPNTQHHFQFKGNVPTMSVVATVPIGRGDEITTSYCPLLWSTMTRRQFLLMTKEFFCACPRCQDPTEFGTYFSAHQCSCTGFILPVSLLDIRKGWKCEGCGKTVSTKEVLSAETNIIKDGNYGRLHKMNYLYVQRVVDKIWKKDKEKSGLSDLSVEHLIEREHMIKEVLKVNSMLRLGNSRMKGNLLRELLETLNERKKRNLEVNEEEVNATIEEVQKILPSLKI